jgi:hypothetical protein
MLRQGSIIDWGATLIIAALLFSFSWWLTGLLIDKNRPVSKRHRLFLAIIMCDIAWIIFAIVYVIIYLIVNHQPEGLANSLSYTNDRLFFAMYCIFWWIFPVSLGVMLLLSIWHFASRIGKAS